MTVFKMWCHCCYNNYCLSIISQNPSGLDGVLGVTAQKHVVLEYDSGTGHVSPPIRMQFSFQCLALENVHKQVHALSGAVQVDVSKRFFRKNNVPKLIL